MPSGAAAPPSGSPNVLIGLIRSCHPIPSAAVTGIATGLAWLAGAAPAAVILVALAVLTGQLSIGWSNDRIDAARDRAVHRADKPVALGLISRRTVGAAAVAALITTMAASSALGWRAALANLLVVACGWAYNLGAKATWWSWLPYAIAFGSLPAVGTLAAPGHPLPAAWAVGAGALFGVSAHLANVLPDLDEDTATGVRGLPHRLGARATAVIAPVLLLVSSLVVLFGAGGAIPAWRWAAAVLLTVVAVGGAVAGFRQPKGRVLFLATVLVVIADVALFAVSGRSLS